MKHYRTVLIIGIIEVLIGSLTLLGTLGSIALSLNTKPPNILLFVVLAALVSTSIGIGILKMKPLAYKLLLYFSTVVIFSKVLVLMGVIEFQGALEKHIPSVIKDVLSVLYHGFVIYYLRHKEIMRIFHMIDPHDD